MYSQSLRQSVMMGHRATHLYMFYAPNQVGDSEVELGSPEKHFHLRVASLDLTLCGESALMQFQVQLAHPFAEVAFILLQSTTNTSQLKL